MAGPNDVTYDPENIFAKILDGKIPSTKVFENKSVVAILDAFPMAKGHTLILPKKKGYKSLLDMPPREVADTMAVIPFVARAVKEATGCEAVNVISNLGAEAGQMVFHPHVHIVPRFKDDEIVKMAGPKAGQITPEEAEEMKAKITESLEKKRERPVKPVQLKKAKLATVGGLKPRQSGLNVKVKCLAAATATDEKKPNLLAATLADSTGAFELVVSKEQAESVQVGETYMIRNFAITMGGGFMRGSIDKWGKVELVTDDDEKIAEDLADAKNVSKVEYEKVK